MTFSSLGISAPDIVTGRVVVRYKPNTGGSKRRLSSIATSMSSGLFTTSFHLLRSCNNRQTKLVMREVVVSFPPTKICTNIESISASVSGSSCDIAACVNSEMRSLGSSRPCAMRSRRMFTSLMRYSLMARRAAISRSGSTMFMPCNCASLHSLNVSRISSGTPSMRAITMTGSGIARRS